MKTVSHTVIEFEDVVDGFNGRHKTLRIIVIYDFIEISNVGLGCILKFLVVSEEVFCSL